MAAPVVIAAIILLLLALILIISYTLYLNSSNEACMVSLNAILTDTRNLSIDPDNANEYCAKLKTAIPAFNAQCPAFSAPEYSGYIPPCV